MELEQEEHQKAQQLCLHDPIYFIKNFCFTTGKSDRDPTDHNAQLIPDLEFVDEVLTLWQERHTPTVIKKSVQTMVTWLGTAMNLWEILHVKNINNGYFSIGQNEASLVGKRMRFMIEHLPSWYIPMLGLESGDDSTFRLEFKARDGSTSSMHFLHSGGKGGRSITFNRVTLDEMAFMDNAEEIWAANKPRCQYLTAFSSPPIRKAGFFFNVWSRPNDFGCKTMAVHYSAFPERDPKTEEGAKWVEREKRGMSDEKWRREYEGEFISEGGMVYANFDRETHVVDPADYPLDPDWVYFRGTDFGWDHPFCTLWVAKIPCGSFVRWYIFHEIYRTETLLKDLAAEILHVDKQDRFFGNNFKWRISDRLQDCVSDAAGKRERQELARIGVRTIPSRKHPGSVRAKLDRVRTSLLPQPDGLPGLIVASGCTNTIFEFENYAYPKNIPEGSHGVDPEKKFDHAMDVIGDLLYTVDGKPKQDKPIVFNW